MKTGKLGAMVMALAGLGLGCGDDASTGSSGGSGDTTGDATTTGNTTTTGADSSTGAGSGSAESGSSGESSSGGVPVEVTVEGNVIDFALSSEIPGSTISIFGDPTISTTADATGFFSIGTFQPNSQALFVLEPSMDYWGAIIPVDIGTDPLQEDQELTQISTAIVDAQIMGLMNQMPQMPDLTQAIMVVRLLQNTAISEGDTIIDMEPPPPDGTYYAPDGDGVPILNQNAIQFPLIPVVVYFNVPDSDPGDITFTATHPTRDCTILYPDLPTIGEHMTLVDVECLPP